MNASSESGISENSQTSHLPAILMKEIGTRKEKIASVLGDPVAERYCGTRKIQFFTKDEWTVCITHDRTGGQVSFFISKPYIGDNREVHLFIRGQYKGKMMMKLRDDTEGGNFIHTRIEGGNFEAGFELPKTPIISSIPAEGNYYHAERDGDLEDYMEKRRKLGEGFFFQSHLEYLQLTRAGYIDDFLAEHGAYSMRTMYSEGRPDEYYKLTGMLSCVPVIGTYTEMAIKDLLEAEDIVGWEILGIFPEPTPPSDPLA